jgi:hypothetical protein
LQTPIRRLISGKANGRHFFAAAAEQPPHFQTILAGGEKN